MLAVDIGNSNITLGVFEGKRLVRRTDIPTHAAKAKAAVLAALCRRHRVREAVICSVVPAMTPLMAQILRRQNVSTRLVTKDIKIPVRNKYRYPGQVGQDRLVNAYAGIQLYGKPLIIVDFGTAVTFDVVSQAGEYLGGMILPGAQVALDALAERTALLPRVRAARPREFIGTDTRASMLSGVINGYASLTDGLIRELCRCTGPCRAVATGGAARLIAPLCTRIQKVDLDLTLKGLMLLNGRAP